MGFTTIPMGRYTKESGWMISSMVRESKNGRMDRSIKGSITMGKRKELGCLNGTMAPNMKVIL